MLNIYCFKFKVTEIVKIDFINTTKVRKTFTIVVKVFLI